MITESYVSLGIAQVLSEKGFDGESHVGYDVLTVDKPWPHKTIPKRKKPALETTSERACALWAIRKPLIINGFRQ